MDEERTVSRAQLVWGAALVVLGLALLALELFDVNVFVVGWPLLIIVPGILFFVGAFSGRPGAGLGFLAVPGAVVTTVGLVLAVQNATGDWQSWSYAWALVAPAAVGLGLLIAGAREHMPRARAAGAWLTAIGLALFAVAEWLMVRVFGVGGAGLGPAFGYVMPVLFMALGLYVVFRAVRPRSEV